MSAAPAPPLIDRLAEIDLLRGMDRQRLARLLPALRLRHVEAGRSIFGRLDSSREVFFVLSGEVKVTVFAENGREVAFRDLFQGDSFGELSAIDAEPRSADVVASRDTLIAVMADGDFRTLIHNEPAVAEATLLKLARLVRALSQRVYEFATPDANRVCAELLRLMTPDGRVTPLPHQTELASRINTHREAVSRVLSELVRRGIAKKDRRELQILDRPALERLASGSDRLD